jgi:hypothetical protein
MGIAENKQVVLDFYDAGARGDRLSQMTFQARYSANGEEESPRKLSD